MRMKLRTWEYFVRETAASMRRNSLMSFASVSTVALSLLILGLFLTLVLNLNHLASVVESEVQISVYLQDGLSDAQTRELGARIAQIPGAAQVNYVSKDQAMARFKQRLGEHQSILSALGDSNPLPNAFEVRMERPEQVKPAAQAISTLPGVENARYGQEVIENLFALTRLVRVFGMLIILFLALAAVFIISNTIRITVFARRREVGIMKFVGATDSFIRWPFLLEGMILGFGGALLAVLALNKTYNLMVDKIYGTLAFLPVIPSYPFLTNISLVLLAAGAIIGALGSTLSLRRFMRV